MLRTLPILALLAATGLATNCFDGQCCSGQLIVNCDSTGQYSGAICCEGSGIEETLDLCLPSVTSCTAGKAITYTVAQVTGTASARASHNPTSLGNITGNGSSQPVSGAPTSRPSSSPASTSVSASASASAAATSASASATSTGGSHMNLPAGAILAAVPLILAGAV